VIYNTTIFLLRYYERISFRHPIKSARCDRMIENTKDEDTKRDVGKVGVDSRGRMARRFYPSSAVLFEAVSARRGSATCFPRFFTTCALRNSFRYAVVTITDDNSFKFLLPVLNNTILTTYGPHKQYFYCDYMSDTRKNFGTLKTRARILGKCL